jgi:tetratricopeptide (TPR) repeat protein
MNSKILYLMHTLSVAIMISVILSFSGCAPKSAPPQEVITAKALSEGGRYKGAFKYYQIAYYKTSSPKEKARIEEKIEQLRTLIVNDILKDAERTYNSEPQKTIELLEQTIALLKQGQRYDTREGIIKKKIERYENEKEALLVLIGKYLKKAHSLYDKNRLREITPLYEKILAINPSNKLIRFKKANLKIEIETMEQRYLRNAQEYSKAGYTESARLFLEKLLELTPNHPAAAKIKKELAISSRTDIVTRLKNFERQKQWFTAYNVLKHSPDLKGYDRAMNYIKARGSKHYYERSIRDFVAGDYYRAYISIDKARILDQNDRGILIAASLCEEKLEKELRKNLIINVSHPSSSMRKQLTKELTHDLFSLLPYALHIKKYTKRPGSAEGTLKVSKNDTIVTVKYKSTEDPETGHDYALIHIIDFEGPALNYINKLKQSSNSFVIPVSHRNDSQESSTAVRDRGYGYENLTQEVAQKVAKILGTREKKFYQLAAMYDGRNDKKEEIKYLALGSFYCKEAKLNTEHCKQLRTLSLSVTE